MIGLLKGCSTVEKALIVDLHCSRVDVGNNEGDVCVTRDELTCDAL